MGKSRSKSHESHQSTHRVPQQGPHDFGSNAEMMAKIQRVQKASSKHGPDDPGGVNLVLSSFAFAEMEGQDLEDYVATHSVIEDANLVDKLSDTSVSAFVPGESYDTALFGAKSDRWMRLVED